jgi:ribosomal protein L11 methyltransferase
VLGHHETTMPYRVDLPGATDAAFDRLVELGALDVERRHDGGIAALMPDAVAPGEIERALGVGDIAVSPATGHDADSVWILSPRSVRAGRVQIVPAHDSIPTAPAADLGALKLIDAAAFGTGLHPTTALCLELLDDAIQIARPDAVLDVGTGSGVLALAALTLGVPRAMGTDIDDEALRVAAENARINGMADRLQLVRGGPEAAEGTWPLVLANILAATLIDMAPVLVRRIAHRGQLVLSGFSDSLEPEVRHAYRRFGLRPAGAKSSASWSAIVLHASW